VALSRTRTSGGCISWGDTCTLSRSQHRETLRAGGKAFCLAWASRLWKVHWRADHTAMKLPRGLFQKTFLKEQENDE